MERMLPDEPDVVAPDGSLVRLLCALPAASAAHFELPPGQTSRAVRHRSVSEIWFILAGRGQMWRRVSGTAGRQIDLQPGLCLTIPPGTDFQFRSTGDSALEVVATTIPPWPGEGEAIPADGAWPPTV